MNRREVIKRTAWLTGVALSAPMMSGILSGCQAEAEPGWMPSFMSEEQAKVAAEMAEAILPKTADSPGAKDVHVVEYMDNLINLCFRPVDQANFLKGLDMSNEMAKSAKNKALYDLSPEEIHELVADMDTKAKAELKAFQALPADQKPKIPEDPNLAYDPKPFFIQFKQLTISGYFTSEVVGEEVLAYSSVPGEYDGCMPYPNEEVKTAWAL